LSFAWITNPNLSTPSKATEGCTTIDNKLVDHTIGAPNVGLIHGAYHFARPAASNGSVQAEFFLANGGAWVDDGQTLPGMVDLENNPSGAQCYGLTQAAMTQWVVEFVDTYSGVTGRYPMIYTTNNVSMCSRVRLLVIRKPPDCRDISGGAPVRATTTGFLRFARSC